MTISNAHTVIARIMSILSHHTDNGQNLFLGCGRCSDVEMYSDWHVPHEFLQYGIEIEFSECPGLANEAEDNSDARYSNAEDQMNDDLAGSIQNAIRRRIMTASDRSDCNRTTWNIISRIAEALAASANNLEDAYDTLNIGSYYSDDVCNYISDNDVEPHDTEDNYSEVEGWNNTTDGTPGIVQEYMFRRPYLYHNAITHVERLFDDASTRYDHHHVPTNGSCHIHISMIGVKHSVDSQSRLHACILYCLFRMYDVFPQCVKDRMKDADANKYFHPDYIPSQKFSAVHNHSNGTFEFRLFGHCNDVCEVEACMQIATTAFLRGYYMYHYGLENEQLSITEFRSIIRQHFNDCINDVPAEHRALADYINTCPMRYNSWVQPMQDYIQYAEFLGGGIAEAIHPRNDSPLEGWYHPAWAISAGVNYGMLSDWNSNQFA